MIELHRPDQEDVFSDEIEERLQDMVAAHKVKRYPDSDDRPLPFLKEHDQIISDREEIDSVLNDIEQQLREQRMVSGDACYIDPRTGEMC